MNITAQVIQGTQIGAKFGVATANLLLEALPNIEEGVYLVQVYWPSKETTPWEGLLHFGPRKTFGGDFSAEVHILDFKADIYGETLDLTIGKKIRDVQAFKNADALFTQIETDILVAQKYFMRQKIWQQWSLVSLTDKEALAHQAVKHLSANAAFLEAQTVFAYAPQLNREISFVPELMKAFPEKKYVFPRIEDGLMQFYGVEHYTDLKPGTYGILEPEKSVPFEPAANDIILVPSVSVGEDLGRLGQGGGFYDRWLGEVDEAVKTIAVLPTWAVSPTVPCEKHDQKIDILITCEAG